MQRQHHSVVSFLVVWFVLADRSVFSHASNPDVELQIGWQPRSYHLDLKSGTEDAAASERGEVEIGNSVSEEDLSLPDVVVSAWNEQVLELDELTRCIRGSETGNAIERWLDCLASQEEEAPAPAAAASLALKPSQTPGSEQTSISANLDESDAELNGALLLADDSMACRCSSFAVGDSSGEPVSDHAMY